MVVSVARVPSGAAAERLMRTLVRERPQRMAADVAYFVHACEEGDNRPGASATLIYHELCRVIQTFSLTAQDLAMVYVYLRRYYAVVLPNGSVDNPEAVSYTASNLPWRIVLHALYLQQSVVHDAPLSKRYWVDSSRQAWRTFMPSAMAFAALIDFDIVLSVSSITSAYIELVEQVEPSAIALFRSVQTPGGLSTEQMAVLKGQAAVVRRSFLSSDDTAKRLKQLQQKQQRQHHASCWDDNSGLVAVPDSHGADVRSVKRVRVRAAC